MLILMLMGAVATPFLALLNALLRGAVLFFPTMLFLGAVHEYIPSVPALPWFGAFVLVALFGLLIPSGGTSVKSS